LRTRLVLLLLFVTSVARAGERPPVTFSGFVDGAYVWNRNDPQDHQNFLPGTGTSGKRANEFILNLAQLQWSRAVSDEERLGFTLSLVAGEGADVVHSGEPDGADRYRHVHQASIAYRLTSGTVLEAGVYPSHIGIEAFYSKDNWNYTRSWLGELSPYYQTGVKASHAFNDRWSAQVHVVNGWQLIHDNNGGKSIGTQIAYTNGPVSASFNTLFGPELPDDGDSRRALGDLVVQYRPSDRLQIGGSLDVASQEESRWRGVAAYVRHALDARRALALRAEEFRDPDGAISGTAQTLRELTLTYEHRPDDRVILKFETRYDESSALVFDGRDSQFLLLLGAVVTF
jgi:hypothetical protein